MNTKALLLFLSLFIWSIAGISQVKIGGEIRPRSEYSHGNKSLASPNQDASFYTSQRTRINVTQQSDLISSKIVLQDVRIWGSQKQLVNNEDFAVSIHEAWAEAALFSDVSIKIGRQELIYDDSRILGNVGWAQQARSHDVAILKYTGSIEAHLGIAHHQNSNLTNNLFDGADAYKNLQYLWLNKKTDKVAISLLALNNGVVLNTNSGQETVYSQTIGTHVKIKTSDALSFAINAYYQGGNVVYTGAKTKLSAYNFLAEANFKPGAVKWTLGYEKLSGNDVSDNSKLQSFTPLYGTNHKFNGFMDYFYVGNHVHNFGLNDLYAKGAYAKNKSSTSAHIHLFTPGSTSGISNSGPLGIEVDLSYSYAISSVTKLSLGYSQMIASDTMEALKGGSSGENNNWAYLMFSFKL